MFPSIALRWSRASRPTAPVAFLLVSLVLAEASAANGDLGNFADSVYWADVVVVGRIAAIERVASGRGRSKTAQIRFETTELWKGEIGDTIRITNLELADPDARSSLFAPLPEDFVGQTQLLLLKESGSGGTYEAIRRHLIIESRVVGMPRGKFESQPVRLEAIEAVLEELIPIQEVCPRDKHRERDPQAALAACFRALDSEHRTVQRYGAQRLFDRPIPHDRLATVVSLVHKKGQSPDVAQLLIRALANVDDPRATDVLLELLNHRDTQFRRAAANALGFVRGGDASVAEVLVGQILSAGDAGLATSASSLVPHLPEAVPLLIEAAQGNDPARRLRAVKALLTLGRSLNRPHAGTKVRLRGSLAGHENQVIEPIVTRRQILATALPELIECARKGNERQLRTAAVGALGQLGPYAERAVPLLVEMLDEPQGNLNVHSVLGKIGATAVPALVEVANSEKPSTRRYALSALYNMTMHRHAALALGVATARLRDDDPGVRAAAVRVLGWLKTKSLPAVDELVERLRDENPRVREEAASALGAIGSADDSVVQGLSEALSDRNERVRRSAARALGTFGPKAVDSAAALAHSLNDSDKYVRISAVQALGQIGPGAEKAVSALADVLEGTDNYTRQQALKALQQIGRASHPAFASIRLLLADPEQETRRAAAMAMAAIGPAAKPALKELSDIVADSQEDATTRYNTALALGGIGGEAFGILRQGLESDDAVRRKLCVSAMSQLSAQAEEVIPHLLRRLDDPDEQVRSSVTVALHQLRREAVPALKAALDSPNPRVREAAVGTLWWQSIEDPTLVPLLVLRLRDEATSVRLRAIGAVRSYPAPIPQAVPFLIDALIDDDASVHRSAFGVLLGYGPAAADATDRLVVLCKNGADEKMRSAALRVLAAIPPPPETLLPLLEHALNDDSVAMQQSAIAAIRPALVGADQFIPRLGELLEQPETRLAVRLRPCAV